MRILIGGGDTPSDASSQTYRNNNPSVALCEQILKKLSDAIRAGNQSISVNVEAGGLIVEDLPPKPIAAVAAPPQAASPKSDTASKELSSQENAHAARKSSPIKKAVAKKASAKKAAAKKAI